MIGWRQLSCELVLVFYTIREEYNILTPFKWHEEMCSVVLARKLSIKPKGVFYLIKNLTRIFYTL